MLQLENNYFRKNELSAVHEISASPGRLRLATGSYIYYIDIKDIVRIQSISNYSKLIFKSGQTLVVSKALGYFDELLADGHFSRIHRTHLVNLLYLKHYLRGNLNKVSLSNDEILPVSRRKKKLFDQKMMLLNV